MIGYVVHQFGGVAGADRSGLDVLRALLAYGEPVVVAAADPKVLTPQSFGWKKAAWRSLLLPRFNIYDPAPKRPVQWLRLLSPNFIHRWAAAHWPQDVRLVLVNGLANHTRWRLVRRSGPKSALICRESPRHFEGRSAGGLDWALDAMRQYDAVIFVSSNCRDEWIALGGTSHDTSFYVPNCCEEEQAEPYRLMPHSAVRDELGLPRDRFILGCVATLQRRKGQDLLIEQLPRLMGQHPNVLVVLCGPQSDYGAQMRQRVAEMGLASSVIFKSSIRNAIPMIRALDVMVLPARAEAMPRVILEAMAVETPVVASRVDGISELIDHDVTGWLFPIDQPQRMVDGIDRVIRRQGNAPAWASAAHRRYWDHFSRAKLQTRYAAVFDQLLGVTGTHRDV
jgi:glycosyltransferase involved in cell wall biosynthesis